MFTTTKLTNPKYKGMTRAQRMKAQRLERDEREKAKNVVIVMPKKK